VGGGWLTVAVPKQPSSASPPSTAAGGAASAGTDANADVAALSYEQARDELVAVVGRLESGAATLEESLALWERGEALATRCQQWLDGARERLSAARASSGEQDAAVGRAGARSGEELDAGDGEDEP